MPGRKSRERFSVSRREFVKTSFIGALAAHSVLRATELPLKARTRGPLHHFFGSYGCCPWDITGRFLLGYESESADRLPKDGETISLGYVDAAAGGTFFSFGATSAWSRRQGAQLCWMPDRPDRDVIYNTRRGDAWSSEIVDLFTGRKRVLPFPVYHVHPQGSCAVSLNFSRLAWTAPACGYFGIEDSGRHMTTPEDDGVFVVDLRSGAYRLLFSLARLARTRPSPLFAESYHWVNKLRFNPDGSRFAFLHCWKSPSKGAWTRLYSASPDGSGLRLLLDGGDVSHVSWRDPQTLLVCAKLPKTGKGCYLVSETSGKAQVFGKGVLEGAGHCVFSPGKRYVATDLAPGRRDPVRRLFLYNVAEGDAVEIGGFRSPPERKGAPACGLYPHWSRDGGKICIDSAHGGTRQIYVVDVSRYTR